jgi:hypothetical protein
MYLGLWIYKRQFDVQNFLFTLNIDQDIKEKHPILTSFVQDRDVYQYLRYLHDVFEWIRLLRYCNIIDISIDILIYIYLCIYQCLTLFLSIYLSINLSIYLSNRCRYNNRIDREAARNITIAEVISEIEASGDCYEIDKWNKSFNSFSLGIYISIQFLDIYIYKYIYINIYISISLT